MSEDHAAKRWVEERFPTAAGSAKAALILAYGAGLDNGGTFARGELRYIDVNQAAHVLLDWGKTRPGQETGTRPRTRGPPAGPGPQRQEDR